MNTQPLISIVIVTRDRKAQLKKCLMSVFLQKYQEIETLVIDNQSSDGTIEMLRTEFPSVTLIRLDRNLGCPGARNIGALNAHGEILFFLDDDCIIDEDAIKNAVPYFLSDAELAILTPQIVEPESNRALFLSGNSMRYTYIFTGVSAIRRTVFDNFGLYPDDFLYGSEESDLAIRVINGNGHILYVPEVKVLHYPSNHRDRNKEIEYKLLNAIRVLLKYAPLMRIIAGIIVKPLTFLPDAFHNHGLRGWLRAVVTIPFMTIKFLAFGKRTPLGWKPFLLSEFLMTNTISTLDSLAQMNKNQLTTSLYKSLLLRVKRFSE